MSDTSGLRLINDYVLKQLAIQFGTTFSSEPVQMGTGGKYRKFTGVSRDGNINVQVTNHGGLTSGGNIPSGKIRSAYAECFFLEKAKAPRKLFVCTNREFYTLFQQDSKGLLNGIELLYFELPPDLKAKALEIGKKASDEML